MATSKTELFKEGHFAFHILTPKYRDEVLMVLSRAFCTEPVCDAIADINPGMKTHIHEWVEFVDYWMDVALNKGLSVVAIDETDHRVAGRLLGIESKSSN